MKAIIQKKYGSPDLLEYKEVEKPEPKENEVLVKVRASSINFMDNGVVRGEPFLIRFWCGFLRPKNKIPGGDIAGKIEAIGSKVKSFKPGDEVFGDISLHGLGAFAEYVCIDENNLALKPSNITFEEAAAVPIAAITALQCVRDFGKIQVGHKVLINGASGGVGTFLLQIAKSFDTEVTAVCSTKHLELVRKLGADHVIDYTNEDFTKNGKCYDRIFGVNGYHSLKEYKRSLNPGGIYVCSGGTGAQIFQSIAFGPLFSITGNKKLVNMGAAKSNKNDLTFLKTLLEKETIKPYIDKKFPLSKVADAFKYFEGVHKKGKIVISVGNE